MKCDQDLCLNFWYDFKKLLWQDELNPRVRCAFGNVFVWNHIVSKVQVYTKSTGTFDSLFTKEVEEHKCPIRSSAIGENISLFLITFMVIWSLSGSSILVDFGWSRVARVVFAWLQWLLVHLGPLGDVVDLVDEDWLRPTCKRRHGDDVLIGFEIIWCIFVGKQSIVFSQPF